MPRWFVPLRDAPTKFRLRLGNEQITLPLGVSVIGRDGGCFLSILDASISRRHARLSCDGERATIEDLGSRNGTRVNGVPISGPHAVRDGDRIGIGSCELVLDLADGSDRALAETPTGRLNVCPDCRTCFTSETEVCPRCGLSITERCTQSTRGENTARGRWSLGMLVETLGKTLLTKRTDEAARLMREAAHIVNTRLHERAPVEADELRALAEAAAWLDKAQGAHVWSDWMRGVDEHLAASAATNEAQPDGSGGVAAASRGPSETS